MPKAMVIEIKPNTNEWVGRGELEFEVAPRIGEHITFDNENGEGVIYKIVSVRHNGKGRALFDLHIVYSRTILEDNRLLIESNKSQ